MRVKIGVRAFNIPASELLNPVSADANNTAGIKFEIKPNIRKAFHLLRKVVCKFLTAIGRIIMYAKKIRRVPTCQAEKAISPFLISIKELPQISARSKRIKIFLKLLSFIFSLSFSENSSFAIYNFLTIC